MRSDQEQVEGLHRLCQAASRLHQINLQLRQGPGDVMEATGYYHAEDVSVVYVTGGYDVWHYDMTAGHPKCCDGWNNCQGHMIQSDLSLETAAQTMADAYMEAKARYVITKTWSMDESVAERVLSDRKERRWFFRQMDNGSKDAERQIRSRYLN